MLVTPAWLSRRAVLGTAAMVVAAGLFALDLEGAWQRSVVWALATQRELHRELTVAVRAVQNGEAFAAWTLVGLSLLYGVFHAVGPGHGKVVIATYLATHESRLRRGVALSVLASLIQGATAIAAVGITLLALDRSLRHAQGTALFMETASYGLVALLGLALAVRGGWRLLNRVRRRHPEHGAEAGHCGHVHGPSVADLARPPSLRDFLATALSIGIRPCSGAILVLLLAFTMKLPLAGVGAVAAMSIGTGVTVSTLAVVSVCARRSALVLAALLADDRGRMALVFDALATAGGLLIVLFGLTLLETSLATARHPLL